MGLLEVSNFIRNIQHKGAVEVLHKDFPGITYKHYGLEYFLFTQRLLLLENKRILGISVIYPFSALYLTGINKELISSGNLAISFK